MKGRSIALDHLNGLPAAALMVDGRLNDLLLSNDAPRPGAIYRAIADRPVKGQGGMFVRTSDGAGFLRQTKGLAPGDSLLVQITGYAEAGKALPVTSKILFKSRYAILTPTAPGLNISRAIKDEARREALMAIAHVEMADSAMGLILRSSCLAGEDSEIAQDINDMLDLATAVMRDAAGDSAEKLTEGDDPHTLAWREWVDLAEIVNTEGCFEDLGVLDQIEELRHPRADLPGGGFIYIEPTRALIAVDVNTGADTSPAAGLKANLATARLLPTQLRLRALAGQIVLDLAPMGKKDRRQFETALRAAFRADPVDTNLVGWTPLGHFELQRKRDRIPLHEVLI